MTTVLLVILIPLAGVSLSRGMFKAARLTCDFEQFWVSGVLADQGENPYRVFLERSILLDELAFNPETNPNLAFLADSPLLGSFITSDPGAGPCNALEGRPNYNTPLFTLAFVPFGRLDFRIARFIWSILQTLMSVALPLLILRFNRRPLGSQWNLILVLLVLAWGPSRITIGQGQMALVTSLLAIVAIQLANRDRPLLSGLCFGLALSKFTLTGALALYFLIYRHYKVLGIALLAQLAGLVGLSLLVQESPLELGGTYLRLLTAATGQGGGVVSLDGWFNVIGLSDLAATLMAAGIGAGVVALFVIPQYLEEARGMERPMPEAQRHLKAHVLVVILVLANLLFAYHRSYDLPIVFTYLAFVAGLGLVGGSNQSQSRIGNIMLLSVVLLSLSMIVPTSVVERFLPDSIDELAWTLGLTGNMVLALGLSIWVLQHLGSLISDAQPDSDLDFAEGASEASGPGSTGPTSVEG